jgi:hypothetical protein
LIPLKPAPYANSELIFDGIAFISADLLRSLSVGGSRGLHCPDAPHRPF